MPSLAAQKFREGRAAAESGRNEEAVAALQASLSIEPSPNTRSYLASVLGRMGRYGSAYRQFRIALKDAEARIHAGETKYTDAKATAEAGASELETHIARLLLVLPADLPSDFRLTVDGEPLAEAERSQPFPLDPGEHSIAASGTGITPIVQHVRLSAGESRNLTLNLARVSGASLQVYTPLRPSGLSLLFDETTILVAGARTELPTTAGSHRLRASAPGYRTYSWNGIVRDGESVQVTVDLRPFSGPPRWLVYGTAGAAAALLISGVIVGSAGFSRDMDNTLQMGPDAANERDTTRNLGLASTALFSAGGALAVSCLALALTVDWKGSGSKAASYKPRADAGPAESASGDKIE